MGRRSAGNFPINFGGESVSGLAVAPDGKIWVAIRNSSKVVQFTNGGAPTGVEVNLGFAPGWIETDGSGNLYVTAEGFGDTVKFNSAGTELFKVETEQYSSTVGVDPANGNVYIAHGNTISAYKSDGAFISSFGGPDPDHGFNGSGNIVDIAVNGSDHSDLRRRQPGSHPHLPGDGRNHRSRRDDRRRRGHPDDRHSSRNDQPGWARHDRLSLRIRPEHRLQRGRGHLHRGQSALRHRRYPGLGDPGRPDPGHDLPLPAGLEQRQRRHHSRP